MSEEFVGWLDDEWNVVLDQSQPIVRCRDCWFCGKGMWGNETFPVCRRGLHTFQVTWDGFCAWGERRKSE